MPPLALSISIIFLCSFFFPIPSDGSDGKESVCNAGELGLIPGWGQSPGEGNGNLLQYSCLENPMDREAWQATVHEVTKSQIWLSNYHLYFHCHSTYHILILHVVHLEIKFVYYFPIIFTSPVKVGTFIFLVHWCILHILKKPYVQKYFSDEWMNK